MQKIIWKCFRIMKRKENYESVRNAVRTDHALLLWSVQKLRNGDYIIYHHHEDPSDAAVCMAAEEFHQDGKDAAGSKPDPH